MNILEKTCKLLTEGGNAHTKDGIEASKIQLSQLEPELYENFQHDVKAILKRLNDEFRMQYGYPIWENLTEEVFNGSSYYFYTKDRETFIKAKPTMGDIDVQIDLNNKEDVIEFMDSIEGITINGFKYNGYQKVGDIYNVWTAPEKYSPAITNFQIDFEFVEFDETKNPNEFDRFTRRTGWNDLEANIKGLAKNVLLSCIYRTLYFRKGIVFTPKRDRPRTQQSSTGNVPIRTFSLKGTTEPFNPVNDENGIQRKYEDQDVYREKPKEEKVYNRKISKVFEEIFKREGTPDELKKLGSYLGILQLMKDNFKPELIQEIYNRLFFKMPDNVDDESVTISVLDKFKNFYGYIKDPELPEPKPESEVHESLQQYINKLK